MSTNRKHGHLVLGRKPGERIYLFDSEGNCLAEVQVVDIDRNRVRTGFRADNLQIYREEVLTASQREAVERAGLLEPFSKSSNSHTPIALRMPEHQPTQDDSSKRA